MIKIVRTNAMLARRPKWWYPHFVDVYYRYHMGQLEKINKRGIGWLDWTVYFE